MSYMLLCEHASVDPATGNASLRNAFDEMRTVSVPVTRPRTELVAKLRGPPATLVTLYVEVVRPNGVGVRCAGEYRLQLNATGSAILHLDLRQIVTLRDFGKNSIALMMQGRELGRSEINVFPAVAAGSPTLGGKQPLAVPPR